MALLIFSVLVVLVVSALCSLAEASIYAVSLTYVREREQAGKRSARILSRFKENIEQPITAILIVNTAANTAGAAVAGSQSRELFGEGSLFWFSALFTFGVLFFSEIMPKVVGVAYSRTVSVFVSFPLLIVIKALYPLVWVIQVFARRLQRGATAPLAPETEVQQMAVMSAQEGSILPMEADLVENVLRLDDLTAREIMTPRSVVFRLSEGQTVGSVADTAASWSHSRIPVSSEEDPEKWVGMVLHKDILASLASDQFDVTMKDLLKPLPFVADVTRGDKLLAKFLATRSHIFGVVDEFGSVSGVVSLEDVTEALIGAEIVDETDTTVDLQIVARKRRDEALGKKGDAARTPSKPPGNADPS